MENRMSSHLPLHPPELWLLPFPRPCGCCQSKIPVHFAQWGVWPFGQWRPSHRLWAQWAWLPHLGGHWILHPGVLQRQQALKSAWLGIQWLHHRHGALFTTVHPGATRKSRPDKLITLLKKVYCPVSRCLSIMLEHGDLFLMSLDHSFQTPEKIHVATQKMSKSGFFWNDRKSRFSLTVEQRFRNSSSKPIMTEEISKNWTKLLGPNEVRLIALFKETNNFDEINNFFMCNYWNKIENFVKLMRKVWMR